MVQRQSEAVRRGNPPDHELAVELVRRHLVYTKYSTLSIKKNLSVKYPKEFIEKHKWKKYPGHTFDLSAAKIMVEIDGIRDYAYDWVSGVKTKHDHTEQKINDGIAKSFLEEYYPNVKLIRLLKEEVNADNGIEYLNKELGFLYI